MIRQPGIWLISHVTQVSCLLLVFGIRESLTDIVSSCANSSAGAAGPLLLQRRCQNGGLACTRVQDIIARALVLLRDRA